MNALTPFCTSFPHALFLTWTTYGTWLPGDPRGWRKWKWGDRQPQPLLEAWCGQRLTNPPICLLPDQRLAVEAAIRAHASIRHWELHALSVRSNHVHVSVSAREIPTKVRNEFKAFGTRALRASPFFLKQERIWPRGGDIEDLDNDYELEQVVRYINEARDRKEE